MQDASNLKQSRCQGFYKDHAANQDGCREGGWIALNLTYRFIEYIILCGNIEQDPIGYRRRLESAIR